MRTTRKRIGALLSFLVGVLFWFDQYRQGYSFSLSDLFDNRPHHEHFIVASFTFAIVFWLWGFRRSHRYNKVIQDN